MDAQLKRGLLENCILSIIGRNDTYGYKIIKDVSPVFILSESTLYTILKRLLNNNMIEEYYDLYNGRNRKYYCITQNGINQLDSFKAGFQELKQIYSYIDSV